MTARCEVDRLGVVGDTRLLGCEAVVFGEQQSKTGTAVVCR